MASVTTEQIIRRVAFLDPASGRKARQSQMKDRARSAIVCTAMDSLFRIFVTYAWADRVSPTELVKKCLEVNALFQPDVFGIESNAQQYLFAELVERDAKNLGEHLPLYPLNQPSNLDKDDRIRNALHPVASTGRLFFMDSQDELKMEWTSFPTGRTKDLIDALASCVILSPKPKSVQRTKGELDSLAEYLRSQKLPPSYIAQRLERVSREMGLANY